MCELRRVLLVRDASFFALLWSSSTGLLACARTAATSERHLQLWGNSCLALALAAYAGVCFFVTEANSLLWPN